MGADDDLAGRAAGSTGAPGNASDGAPAGTPTKQEVRRARRAVRRAVDPAVRAQRDAQLTARALEVAADAEVVGCYLSLPVVPRPTDGSPGAALEPGTLDLVESLWQRGRRVLVPMLSPTADGPRHDPNWAWYRGRDDLRPGLWGILEPSGPGLGAAALGEADLVFCSGLAGTPDGRRLGVGGGWHDRALGFARPDSTTVLLLDDDDLLDELPTEPHDRRVDLVLTPTRTVFTRPMAE